MTTRAIVPNGDGEGSLGTVSARWGAIYSSDPASGENSGQVPTTAWVQKLVAEVYKKAKLDAHPVGSYYWSNDSTSPATLFGGTWEALPPGYTLIAQGSGSDSFGSFTYTAGQKYGERKHPLTTEELASHGHSGSTSTNGDHSHTVTTFNGFGKINGNSYDGYCIGSTDRTTSTAGNHQHSLNIDNTGGDQPHNNIPPVIASYGWRRTA